jgi:hypothetical protein
LVREAAGEPGDVEVALERLANAERFELAPFDLFGDGVAGEEGDPESFPGGTFDRLARVQFLGTFGPHVRARERPFADAARARARLADEERLPRELLRVRAPVAEGERTGLGRRSRR